MLTADIQVARRLVTGDLRIGLLMTGLDFADAFDGWALAALARQRDVRVGLIYSSAEDDREWRVRGCAESEWLQQPFTEVALLAAVKSQLDRGMLN